MKLEEVARRARVSTGTVSRVLDLTDKEKRVLTPYHVFRMYAPSQDATFVPVPVTLTAEPAAIAIRVSGVTAAAASGEALAAPAVDSVNTFESPKTVAPKPITAKVQDGQVALTLDPKSVTGIAIR
jgi:alpha-N-arabinofuranosidase